MRELVRRLWWMYRCNRKIRTHPDVHNSWIENLSGVDRSARIRDSRLYGTVQVAPQCVLDECDIRANARVAVGRRSVLTGPIRLVADLNPVEIGKFCSFAPHVAVWESLHDHRRISTYSVLAEIYAENFRRDIVSKGSVRIGNDVWIGTHSVILSGVTIGDGAVIAAGSVVTRDIPAYVVAAGAPAVALKARFPQPIVERLQVLRWWDWSDEEFERNRFVFEGELSLEILDQIQR